MWQELKEVFGMGMEVGFGEEEGAIQGSQKKKQKWKREKTENKGRKEN